MPMPTQFVVQLSSILFAMYFHIISCIFHVRVPLSMFAAVCVGGVLVFHTDADFEKHCVLLYWGVLLVL